MDGDRAFVEWQATFDCDAVSLRDELTRTLAAWFEKWLEIASRHDGRLRPKVPFDSASRPFRRCFRANRPHLLRESGYPVQFGP